MRLEQLLKDNAGRVVHSSLVGAIEKLAQILPPDSVRNKTITALKSADTSRSIQFVITGQQAGFAGGPLLTLIKAAAAVVCAEQIEKQSGRTTVPLFWLQTEDHDLREALSIKVPTGDGTAEELFPSSELIQAESSRMPLNDLNAARWSKLGLELLAPRLESLASGRDALSLINAAYQGGRGFGDALAWLLSALLPESGLLFFNPRDPEILALGRPVFRLAFERSEEIEKLLKSSDRPEQVRVVSGSPLFFFHDQDGGRSRLKRTGDGDYQIGDGPARISAAEISNLIETSPERFSTTALLRPLLEDSYFPTAAYVGGGAELAYLRQISPLYPLFKLTEPLRLARPQAAVGEAKFRPWLESFGLRAADLFREPAQLLNQIAGRAADGVVRLSPEALKLRALELIRPGIQFLKDQVESLDQTLIQPVERIEKKIGENLDGLAVKYGAAVLRKDSILSERLARMQRMFFPGGIAQERTIGVVYFLARFGVGFGGAILSAIRSTPTGGAGRSDGEPEKIELFL